MCLKVFLNGDIRCEQRAPGCVQTSGVCLLIQKQHDLTERQHTLQVMELAKL